MGTRRIAAVLVLLLLGAATAFAYAQGTIGAGLNPTAVSSSGTTEPVALLLFGSALLAIAGAVRRLSS